MKGDLLLSLARVLLLAVAVAAASACSVSGSTAPPDDHNNEGSAIEPTLAEDATMNGQNRFELNILEGDWASLALGYDHETAWAALQESHASESAFRLSEEDVVAYDWEEQVLTLSPESTKQLVEQLARTDEQREHPEAALDQRAFVVSLDGEPIYGGIFLHPMSSMGISFPVMYVEVLEGQVSFTVRPVHSVLGDYSEYEPDWLGIKDQRIHDLFADAG